MEMKYLQSWREHKTTFRTSTYDERWGTTDSREQELRQGFPAFLPKLILHLVYRTEFPDFLGTIVFLIFCSTFEYLHQYEGLY